MTPQKPTALPVEPSQADKFRDMARELEADEDPAHFERVARQIVDAPVPPKEAKPKRD